MSVNGEALVFQLTVDDDVNIPVISTVTVNVVAYAFNGQDSLVLAASNWVHSASYGVEALTSVAVADDVLTVVVPNNFKVGETVSFASVSRATFLNGQTVTIATANATQFTASFTHADYAPLADSRGGLRGVHDSGLADVRRHGPEPTCGGPDFVDGGVTYLDGTPLVYVLTAPVMGEYNLDFATGQYFFAAADASTAVIASYSLTSPATIAQRNTPLTWASLSKSAIYTNANRYRRGMVLSGDSRIAIISPYSVLIYGDMIPDDSAVLLRELLIPTYDNGGHPGLVVDAIQTELDYAIVLTTTGNLYRYSSAPLLSTDNPDTELVLSNYITLTAPTPPSSAMATFYALGTEILDANGNIQLVAIPGTSGSSAPPWNATLGGVTDDTAPLVWKNIGPPVVFNSLFSTPTFDNVRVLALSGPDGCFLMQMDSQLFRVEGFFEISKESGSAHGCYDDHTETLTKNRGFVLFKNLLPSDMVATRNPKTHAFEWQKPTAYLNVPYSGDMYAFKSRSMDLVVTPEHRVLTADSHTGNESVHRADEFAKKHRPWLRIPVTSVWGGGEEISEQQFQNPCKCHSGTHPASKIAISGDDFCALLGAYLSEGNIRSNGGIEINQLKHSKGFLPYKALIEKINGSAQYTGKAFVIPRRALTEYFQQFGNAATKFVPEIIKNAPIRQLKIFWDFFMLGDGSKTKRKGGHRDQPPQGETLVTISKKLADDMVEIAQKLGWSAGITVVPAKTAYVIRALYDCKEQYIVTVRYSKAMSVQSHKVHYDGTIHCVSVPNGIIYVRRNNKPCWSGNSDNVQWVREASVESLRSGKVLLGTLDSEGHTYETLIDLTHRLVIGTWDASKLKNQYVTTGEILFEQESPYVGLPVPLVMQTPVVNPDDSVTLAWAAERPDLVGSYQLQYAGANGVFTPLTFIGSGIVESYTTLPLSAGETYGFRVRSGSADGQSVFSNTVYAYIGTPLPPAAQQIIHVSGPSGGPFVVTVTWNQNLPTPQVAVSYTVQMSTGTLYAAEANGPRPFAVQRRGHPPARRESGLRGRRRCLRRDRNPVHARGREPRTRGVHRDPGRCRMDSAAPTRRHPSPSRTRTRPRS